MKKFLLIACLFTVFAGQKASAQSFTLENGDTVRANANGAAQTQINNDIKNNTSSPLTLNWVVTNSNIPTSWSFEGLCDNNLCYSNLSYISSSPQSTSPIAASAKMDFHIIFDATNAANGTSAFVTAKITDPASSYQKSTTFVATKSPTGVVSVIKSDDEVTLYPNPARNNLNVVFNENAGVKTIAVYNLIGKPVSTFRVSGASAQLDISDIPSGVYFIRLMDAQNRVLATRKFTRQ